MEQFSKMISNIEKKFGKEAISGNKADVEFISSGILSLDLAMGGGFAKGRIIELYGWESTGKSTIALMLASQVQKLNKAVGYIDMEHVMDLSYAKNLDVNTELDSSLWVMSQPDDGEQALDIVREMLKYEELGLLVIDSVTALVPKAVLQGDAGDAKMGLQARLMSKMIPTLISPARKSGCIVLFINQLREKIGIVWGNPTTTTGGNALKFYASQRLEISKISQNKNGDEVLSNRTRVKITKNKVAPPFLRTEFNIEFGTGVDILVDMLEVAVDMEIVKKSGSWFSYDDIKLGQGFDNVRDLLKDNPELVEEIRNKINTKLSEV